MGGIFFVFPMKVKKGEDFFYCLSNNIIAEVVCRMGINNIVTDKRKLLAKNVEEANTWVAKCLH